MFPSTPDRLSLALLPTPFQPLTSLSRQLGSHRVWVKRDDLTESVSTGNKIRKLEFIFAAAIANGCDTVITCGGIQSNHCRATAALGARLGLKIHLILRGAPGPQADGNLLLDRLFGAEISYYSEADYFANLTQIFADTVKQYAARGHKAWTVPTGASDGIGIWGYIHACEELRQNFKEAGIAPKHIVCATGSGGTQAGLTVGAVAHHLNAQVHGIAVSDDAQYFIDKVSDDIDEWQQRYGKWGLRHQLQINAIDDYVGPCYGEAGPEIYRTIEHVARTEGLLLDPVYTGKAFYGMLKEIHKGTFGESGDVVFVHTGGSFGVFPHRDHFSV
ncbi:MAG TPA: D-cysteine desulfhydrase family protein [Pseudomonadales bacterium]|nr:D-cysteine desulfhydrase family protein [Pseudomonadales bacterium]